MWRRFNQVKALATLQRPWASTRARYTNLPKLGFLHFYRPGGQVITQKISSWARKRRASSIDKMVRPNGPVEAHRFFQSDQ